MPNPICNNSRLVFFASPASRNPSSTSIVDRFHSSSYTISYPSEGFRGKEYSILFRLAFGRRSLAFHRSGVELVVTDNKTHASGWVEQTVNKLNPFHRRHSASSLQSNGAPVLAEEVNAASKQRRIQQQKNLTVMELLPKTKRICCSVESREWRPCCSRSSSSPPSVCSSSTCTMESRTAAPTWWWA